ncbi:hypothetical protein DPMN_107301 [Dreissena polymorpha]|uniref:Uncharacterized protein n=1 Tax=Dreissena polymorpha TaxID=45954 RepID=A0A9D4QJN4_DREPO|nr:hypothetical protein DPMN_107301 [Dreissena polymorpha]
MERPWRHTTRCMGNVKCGQCEGRVIICRLGDDNDQPATVRLTEGLRTMTDRHRTERVRRPKDSGQCTWTDHVGRFSAKHLHFKHGKCHLHKQKHDQEKEEPLQPHINPEQAESIAQSKKMSNASECTSIKGSSLNPKLDPPSFFTSLWFFELLNYYHSSNYNGEAENYNGRGMVRGDNPKKG